MTRVRTTFLAAGLGIALAAAFWFLLLPRLQPHVFSGTVIQSQTPPPDVQLATTTGARAGLGDFEGKLVVVYFGYTFCPDVCPTTLSTLKKAVDKLGGDADDVQVVMVSVDPERDTPEVLADYLTFFDPGFIGMTGTDEEVFSVASSYGVFYQAREGTIETGYLVDHSAHLMVIDQEGYLKLVLPPDLNVDQIADDLDYLL